MMAAEVSRLELDGIREDGLEETWAPTFPDNPPENRSSTLEKPVVKTILVDLRPILEKVMEASYLGQEEAVEMDDDLANSGECLGPMFGSSSGECLDGTMLGSNGGECLDSGRRCLNSTMLGSNGREYLDGTMLGFNSAEEHNGSMFGSNGRFFNGTGTMLGSSRGKCLDGTMLRSNGGGRLNGTMLGSKGRELLEGTMLRSNGEERLDSKMLGSCDEGFDGSVFETNDGKHINGTMSGSNGRCLDNTMLGSNGEHLYGILLGSNGGQHLDNDRKCLDGTMLGSNRGERLNGTIIGLKGGDRLHNTMFGSKEEALHQEIPLPSRVEDPFKPLGNIKTMKESQPRKRESTELRKTTMPSVVMLEPKLSPPLFLPKIVTKLETDVSTERTAPPSPDFELPTHLLLRRLEETTTSDSHLLIAQTLSVLREELLLDQREKPICFPDLPQIQPTLKARKRRINKFPWKHYQSFHELPDL